MVTAEAVHFITPRQVFSWIALPLRLDRFASFGVRR
jgi:hypothetical protein